MTKHADAATPASDRPAFNQIRSELEEAVLLALSEAIPGDGLALSAYTPEAIADLVLEAVLSAANREGFELQWSTPN